jgi:D-sedoheptulose 7-phosphate isomerase
MNKIILTAGNGGSASQASHLTGELMGRYKKDRPPLASVCCSSEPSTVTCIANDYGFDKVFTRPIIAFRSFGILPVLFTTSGQSSNVLNAIDHCSASAIPCIMFTGARRSGVNSDYLYEVNVNSYNTAYIQQVHLALVHYFCEAIDTKHD